MKTMINNTMSRLRRKIEILALVTLMISFKQTLAYHGSPKSCYECAEKYPDNYFCYFDGVHKDPWKGACCADDNKSPFCAKESYNRCSAPSKEMGPFFYQYCPMVSNKMCGTKDIDMSFKVGQDKEVFKWDGLRRIQEKIKADEKDLDGDHDHKDESEVVVNKNDRYDACMYTFTAPTAQITFGDILKANGHIDMKFKAIDSVEITVVGVPAEDGSKENKTFTPEVGKTYKMSLETNTFVIVLPKLNA